MARQPRIVIDAAADLLQKLIERTIPASVEKQVARLDRILDAVPPLA